MKLRTLSAVLTLAAALVAGASDIAAIDAESLRKRLQSNDKPLVVDVREPAEFDAGHIREALLVPLGTVANGLGDVAKDREIVLVCRSGRRSAKAHGILAAKGYTKLVNLEGGMLSWEKLGYPVEKKNQ